MIELKSVDIKEFKKNLYSQYMKLFPKMKENHFRF